MIVLPAPEDDQDNLLKDQNWRIVYGAPIIICEIIPMILISIFFKHPSMRELLSSETRDEESDELIKYLKKIYIIKTDQDLKQAIEKVFKEQDINCGKESDEALDEVTLLQGLKSRKHRFGIINANLLCFFAQFTGISVYTLFST